MKFLYPARRATLFAASCLFVSGPAYTHDGDGGLVTYATDHAPVGVMADHRHKQGEWMTSYRFSFMDIAGSRDGADRLTPEEIVTTTPNPFGMPPTLRVVPTDMAMKMHMAGVMYGLSDRITFMAMGMVMTKEMDHITFQGPAGTTRLGNFTTETAGFGDTTVAAIIGLDDGSNGHRQINVALGLSIPTGSIGERDEILTPMGTTPSPRLPYPMQLGSGTFDIKPSATARTRIGKVSIGGQLSGVIRLGDNAAGYTFGDKFEATGWAAFEPRPWVSISARLRGGAAGAIDGRDALIAAPVQTADPENHGGETLEALIGVNFAGQRGLLKGHRLAIEVGKPLYRNLNGPQLETDFTLTVGWQKAF